MEDEDEDEDDRFHNASRLGFKRRQKRSDEGLTGSCANLSRDNFGKRLWDNTASYSFIR